jgi:methylmalonyl-CoA mutase N-terminal domain/subunit
VNRFTEQEEQPLELLKIDETAERRQIERLNGMKQRRSASEVEKTLNALRRAVEGQDNTMPFILDAVKAYATVGEIAGAMNDVFGSYTETSVL